MPKPQGARIVERQYTVVRTRTAARSSLTRSPLLVSIIDFMLPSVYAVQRAGISEDIAAHPAPQPLLVCYRTF
jgi:hypothetical protein